MTLTKLIAQAPVSLPFSNVLVRVTVKTRIVKTLKHTSWNQVAVTVVWFHHRGKKKKHFRLTPVARLLGRS